MTRTNVSAGAARDAFRSGVEGVAVATRPTSIDARPVEGLVLRFEAGRIVDVQADAGADAVRAQIATDPGACRLGEVALVDGSSGLARLGRVYYDQLVDENAACHIAWGDSYPQPEEWGTERHPEACEARGVNPSAVHQDMMIGGPEVEVLGVTASGEEVPILLGERWQLDSREAKE